MTMPSKYISLSVPNHSNYNLLYKYKNSLILDLQKTISGSLDAFRRHVCSILKPLKDSKLEVTVQQLFQNVFGVGNGNIHQSKSHNAQQLPFAFQQTLF